MSYFRTCYKCGKGTMVRYATDEAICSECFDKEEKMDLKDIEPVGVVVQDGNDHGLIESEVIQGVSTLPVGTKIYTAEQMQQYAEAMVYEGLYKHTAFGTGKEELVKHMTNIFFQEKELQEAQDEEV